MSTALKRCKHILLLQYFLNKRSFSGTELYIMQGEWVGRGILFASEAHRVGGTSCKCHPSLVKETTAASAPSSPSSSIPCLSLWPPPAHSVCPCCCPQQAVPELSSPRSPGDANLPKPFTANHPTPHPECLPYPRSASWRSAQEVGGPGCAGVRGMEGWGVGGVRLVGRLAVPLPGCGSLVPVIRALRASRGGVGVGEGWRRRWGVTGTCATAWHGGHRLKEGWGLRWGGRGDWTSQAQEMREARRLEAGRCHPLCQCWWPRLNRGPQKC